MRSQSVNTGKAMYSNGHIFEDLNESICVDLYPIFRIFSLLMAAAIRLSLMGTEAVMLSSKPQDFANLTEYRNKLLLLLNVVVAICSCVACWSCYSAFFRPVLPGTSSSCSSSSPVPPTPATLSCSTTSTLIDCGSSSLRWVHHQPRRPTNVLYFPQKLMEKLLLGLTAAENCCFFICAVV